MEFIKYINSLPNVKVDTIKQIADATCSSVQTVYRWLSGETTVPPLKRKIIADLLNMPESTLWPEDND